MSKRMSKTMQRKMARLYTEYLLSKGEEGGNCPDWIDHLRALAEKDAVLAGIISMNSPSTRGAMFLAMSFSPNRTLSLKAKMPSRLVLPPAAWTAFG